MLKLWDQCNFLSRHSENGKGDGVHRWTKMVLTTVAVRVRVLVCWKMIVLVGGSLNTVVLVTVVVLTTICERIELNQRVRRERLKGKFVRWYSS